MTLFSRFFCLLFVVSLAFAVRLEAQNNETFYRFFFRDKGAASLTQRFEPGAALYEQTRALHTTRALERRKKALPSASLLSLEDAPIYPPYLDSLRAIGAVVALQSRWNNYAVVRCSPAVAARAATFSFVRAARRASERLYPTTTTVANEQASRSVCAQTLASGDASFDAALGQLSSLGVHELHAMGITGKGVRVGIADTGFRWKAHESTKNVRVIAEYDFIFADSATANEAQDTTTQDEHGTEVLSALGGFDWKNRFAGAAPQAEFLFAKTENVRYERNIEQDNFAVALEWLEAQGADIISVSLGYFDFDTVAVDGAREESYGYGEIDGKTSIAARAVNAASARGVLCVVAAGNDGPAPQTLSTPGDADSALTVGAMRQDSALLAWSRSSRGPRADGRTKPDVAAQGEKALCASLTAPDAYQLASGTSLATPLIAGCAALALSAFPELSAWQTREILTATASRASAPDNEAGYGLANAPKALERAGIVVAPELAFYPAYLDAMRVVAAARSSASGLKLVLWVRFAGGREFRPFPMRTGGDASWFYYADLPVEYFGGRPAECYVVAENARSARRTPFAADLAAQAPAQTVSPRASFVPFGINPATLPLDFPLPDIIEGVRPRPVLPGEAASLMLVTPESGELKLRLYSAAGILLLEETVAAQTGLTTIPLRLDALAQGAYFIQTFYNGGVRVFSFVAAR